MRLFDLHIKFHELSTKAQFKPLFSKQSLSAEFEAAKVSCQARYNAEKADAAPYDNNIKGFPGEPLSNDLRPWQQEAIFA